jgi:hypothetical protein
MKNNIVLILLGSAIAFILYKSYYYDNIFRLFFYLGFGIPCLFIFIKSIINSVKDYRTANSISVNYTLIIGIILIIINVSIYSYFEKKINSPSLIKATIFGGFTDFKKNGEYIVVVGSWASRIHYYGTYKINDSIIILDKSDFNNILTTDRLVIRNLDNIKKDTYKDKVISIKKQLIQIDKNGKEIPRDYYLENFRLPIVIDNLPK